MIYVSLPKLRRWLSAKNPRQYVATDGRNPIEVMFEEEYPRTSVVGIDSSVLCYSGYERGGRFKKLQLSPPVSRFVSMVESLEQERISAGRALQLAQQAQKQ